MDQVKENRNDEGIVSGDSLSGGTIHISEEVIVELTKKTIQGIPNIQTVSKGLASKFGIGRKGGDGIRVAVEDGTVPAISVDAYVLVKYGQRIPDLAWNVQEKIKANLERYTGYEVKTVNINVQGIYVDEPILLEEEAEDAPEEEAVPDEAAEESVAERPEDVGTAEKIAL